MPRILETFKQGLREHRYIEGQNVTIEFRFPASNSDRLADIAADLVRMKPDVILGVASSGLEAVRSATSTIPVVALDLESDPLASKMIEHLARPGGNITGVFLDFPELAGKWLELLKAVSPKLARVAILLDPATGRAPLKGAEVAAPTLKLQLQIFEARGPSELEDAFRSAIRARAGAILALSSPVLNTHRRLIVDLAAKHRIPAIMPFPLFAEDGGLMAYGPDLIALYRQAGGMVAKVLTSGRPGDIPIERPNRFVLAINLKTASALGLSVPRSVLIQSDQVIE